MILCFDEYELDPERLELRLSGVPVRADTVVVRLLAALASDAGQLVTNAELMNRVWGARKVSAKVISVTVARLRKTLGHKPGEREFVVNLQGRGYRFVRAVTKADRPLEPVLDGAAKGPSPLRDEAQFVGRDGVMSALRRALSNARDGQGSICVLTGEPGIGKTRAVEQLAREATNTHAIVAWGNCLEAGDAAPLWPFRELTRALHKARPPAASSAPENAAEEPAHELVDGLTPFDERPAAKHRLFEAVLDVFAQASRAAPCLLILDDVHRADAASLELLRHWVDRIARTRVLLVCTMRDAESRFASSQADLSYLKSHRNCLRIALERLPRVSVRAYVEGLFEDPEGQLARAVYVKSEGNPFYMVELTRQLQQAERPAPESLAVPVAALELVRPWLCALDQTAAGVLSCAAVIGQTFDLRTLAAVTERDVGTLMTLLDAGIVHDVVKATAGTKTTFGFGHDLLRRTLYETVEPSVRRTHHLRIADALEQQRLSGITVSRAMIAYHRYEALPEGDVSKTVAACAQAADEAVSVFACADGVRHLNHALEALALCSDASPAQRMHLLFRLTFDARVAALPEFETAVRSLIRIAREQKSLHYLTQAAISLDLHPGFPPLPGARAVLQDALSLLPPDDCESGSFIHARRATSAPCAYDDQTSTEAAALARDLSERGGSVIARFAALHAQLYLTGGPAHGATAREVSRAFEQLCDENRPLLAFPPVMLEFHRAITALQRGQPSTSSAALAAAEARCRDLDSRELLWHVKRFQTLLALSTGGAEGSLASLRTLHRLARERAIVATELFILLDEAIVLADRPLHPSLHGVCSYDDADPPSVWSMKARLLAAAGHHRDAKRELGRVAPAQLTVLPRDRDYLGTLGSLARVALSLGARDYCEALYSLLVRYENYFAVHVSFLCEGSVAQLCGELSQALGQSAAAREHFERSRAIATLARLGTDAK